MTEREGKEGWPGGRRCRQKVGLGYKSNVGVGTHIGKRCRWAAQVGVMVESRRGHVGADVTSDAWPSVGSAIWQRKAKFVCTKINRFGNCQSERRGTEWGGVEAQ